MDQGYHAGSAYMILGLVFLETPRLLGGSAQESIEYFEKGLKFGPQNSVLRWHLARAMLQVIERKRLASRSKPC